MFREILYAIMGLPGNPQPFQYATLEWVVALAGAALFLALGVFGVFTPSRRDWNLSIAVAERRG